MYCASINDNFVVSKNARPFIGKITVYTYSGIFKHYISVHCKLYNFVMSFALFYFSCCTHFEVRWVHYLGGYTNWCTEKIEPVIFIIGLLCFVKITFGFHRGGMFQWFFYCFGFHTDDYVGKYTHWKGVVRHEIYSSNYCVI